jgi:carbamoyltransferase
MDLAASIQRVTEEIVLRMARAAKAATGARYLCLAGGVALNCVANGLLLRERIFEDIFIPGPAGDAGGALGAALFADHQIIGTDRKVNPRDSMRGCLLGPSFTNTEISKAIEARKAVATFYEQEDALLDAVVEILDAGKIVGWFQGRMEFGPRALGSRSIIGDPRNPEMQSRMNVRIKFRESFRPFAPSVLEEDVSEWFVMDRPSPYMLLTAPVHERHHRVLSAEEATLMQDADLRKRVNVPRSSTAVTHVDMSARIQTVDETRHGRYKRLLDRFKNKTGVGMLVNTSFNVRGEPIVCTPDDAIRCFMACDMDALVLENYILLKEAQPELSEGEKRRHIEQFHLD